MELVSISIIIFAIFIGFYTQTISGFGSGLISIPIMIFVLTIEESVALISILFFLFSTFMIYKNFKYINKETILEMALGIIIGVIIGVFLLDVISSDVLKKILGIFILLFVFYKLREKTEIKLFKKSGIIFGLIGGIFSGMYSSGGPIIVSYIYNKLKNDKIIRATIIGGVGISDFARLPLLITSKIITYEIFLLSLIVIPFFLLSIYLGQKTYNKIDKKIFTKIILTLLVISAINLIFI